MENCYLLYRSPIFSITNCCGHQQVGPFHTTRIKMSVCSETSIYSAHLTFKVKVSHQTPLRDGTARIPTILSGQPHRTAFLVWSSMKSETWLVFLNFVCQLFVTKTWKKSCRWNTYYYFLQINNSDAHISHLQPENIA